MNMSDYKSICFNSADFTNFITFVKSMNNKDKSKYSKVVLLHVENSILVCRAIDDVGNYIEYYVDLYSTTDIISEFIAVSINDIATLIKSSSGDKITIRKCFNQYELSLIGDGWLPFNTSDIDLDKFKLSGNETTIGNVNSVKLRDAINSVLGYTQEYTYVRDKYIVFNKNQMLVTSRSSSVITSGKFVDMILLRDDAARIKLLLKDNYDLTISKVEDVVEKLSFTGPKFKFVIRASGIDVADVKYIDNIDGYVTVNSDELFKLVSTAEEYSASKHTVGLIIKNGKLMVSIKNTLAANHISTIDSKQIGSVEDTKEAIISNRNLLKTLKLFQDKHSREISVYFNNDMLDNQNCIILFDNNTQAIICNR